MNSDTEQPLIEYGIFANRRYRFALTATILLFLVMLTMAILLLILYRGIEEDRETEFNQTLTAIFDQLPQSNPALFAVNYPVILAPDSPTYAAAGSCDQHTLSGVIWDADGAPSDAFDVALWGDSVPYQLLNTGTAAGLDSGHWALTLDGTIDRNVYVQIAAGDRYRSAPVTLVLHADDCEQNAVTVNFTQVAPLDS